MIAEFKDAGTCLPEGPKASNIHFCASPSEVKINPKNGMIVTSNSIDDLVCVEVNNNPSNGDYIKDVSTQPSAALNKMFDSRLYSFAPSTFSPPVPAPSKFYRPGTPVVSAWTADATFDASPANKTLVNVFGGYASIPVTGIDGLCTNDNILRYGEEVRGNSCLRKASAATIAEDCSTIYSIDYMIRYSASTFLSISFFRPPIHLPIFLGLSFSISVTQLFLPHGYYNDTGT
jgi:hypothetical protein